jgi:hypothetical protein
MKSILRTTTVSLALFILLNIGFTGSSYAFNPGITNFTDTAVKNVNLGCITKKIIVKANFNSGLLVKSKRFVFYINRKQKHILFVSDRLAFSKGNFEYM